MFYLNWIALEAIFLLSYLEIERAADMFCIAICDDEEVLCSQMEQLLQPYIKDSMVKTDVFYSGEALYKAMYEGAHYDLIFLDIEFQMMNGVDIGKKIRNELKDERVQIVYISAKQEYAMELFAVRPMNFLVKPVSEKEVINSVERTMKLAHLYDTCFEFKIASEYFRIPYGDIMYFESSNRKIRIYTACGVKEIYGRLKAIEKSAPPNFIRIHQSYLINRMHVTSWKFNEVVVNGQWVLSVSKPYRKTASKLLLQNEGSCVWD